MPDFTDGLTAVSILIATVVAVIQMQANRRQERRHHAVELLANFHQEGLLAKSRLTLTEWKRAHRTFPNDLVSPEDDAVIIYTLNFYDFMAALILEGHVDRDLLIDYGGGAIKSDYELFSGYIAARRQTLNRPRLYRSLERVYEEVLRDAATN